MNPTKTTIKATTHKDLSGFLRLPRIVKQFIILACFSLLSISSPSMAADSSITEHDDEISRVITAESNSQTDTKIQLRLEEIYQNVPGLNDIKVSVNQGVVTLVGEVANKKLAQQANTLASRMDNAVLLDSQLTLTTDVQFRLETLQSKITSYLNYALKILPLIGLAIIIFILGLALSRLSGVTKPWLGKLLPNPFIAELASQLIKLSIVVIALIIALDIVGAGGAITSIAGGLGIFGLALGFATRDSIENYIASILLSVKQPFSPLDHVDIAGNEGRVLSLTARSTILMSFDGNHIRIPNSNVYKATITNFSRNPQRRFAFSLGVSTTTNLIKARNVALACIETTPGVLSTPEPVVIIDSLGDSSIILKVMAWVNQNNSDFSKVRGETIRQVKVAFDQNEIDMPNPIINIAMDSDEKTTIDPVQTNNLSPDMLGEQKAIEANADIEPDRALEQQIMAEQDAHKDDNLLSSQAKQEL